MTGLSEQQLAEIQARAEATTAGPWMADGAEIYRAPWGYVVLDLWVGETLRIDDQGGSNADAEFVAHARTDVPALLARVAELEAEVAARETHGEHLAKCLVDRTTELLNAEANIKELEARLFQVGMARRYRLESGKDFVYVEDIRDAVLGKDAPEAGESRG